MMGADQSCAVRCAGSRRRSYGLHGVAEGLSERRATARHRLCIHSLSSELGLCGDVDTVNLSVRRHPEIRACAEVTDWKCALVLAANRAARAGWRPTRVDRSVGDCRHRALDRQGLWRAWGPTDDGDRVAVHPSPPAGGEATGRTQEAIDKQEGPAQMMRVVGVCKRPNRVIPRWITTEQRKRFPSRSRPGRR